MAIKSIKQITQKLNLEKNMKEVNRFEEADSKPKFIQVVNYIVDSITACKPAWKQAFTTKKHFDTYRKGLTEALFENSITTEQIEMGLVIARRDESPWLPPIGQFISWCRYGESDDIAEAFTRLINGGKPKNDIERATWNVVGYECRTRLPQALAFKRFKDEYRRLTRMAQQGIQIVKKRVYQLENKSKPSQRASIEMQIQQRRKNGPQTELEKQVLSIKDRKRER